jgi:hypothetical protein
MTMRVASARRRIQEVTNVKIRHYLTMRPAPCWALIPKAV